MPELTVYHWIAGCIAGLGILAVVYLGIVVWLFCKGGGEQENRDWLE